MVNGLEEENSDGLPVQKMYCSISEYFDFQLHVKPLIKNIGNSHFLSEYIPLPITHRTNIRSSIPELSL